MTVFHIPGYLRTFTDGLSRVHLDRTPPTVGEALAALWAVYPGVRDRVVDEQGDVRQHVNVFVGDESIRFTGGLATAVGDGSEIWIVPAVSGGIDQDAARTAATAAGSPLADSTAPPASSSKVARASAPAGASSIVKR